MRAAVYSRYGPPDVVEIKDVAKPVPRDNEVLIQVRVASVNPLDWHGMRGKPYIMRAMSGLGRPKDARLGFDLSGRVEAVGGSVTQFKSGDEVFGMCRGTFAEYACAPESAAGLSALAIKPESVTFEQAAATPVAGFTALQSLRDAGRIKPGKKILINGAAGGVGSFAVQIAKCFGANVTGVCSAGKVNMVQSLGADFVIDYAQQNFTKGRERYDLVLDCAGNHSLLAYRQVLNSGGLCVVVTGPDGRWLGPLRRFVQALALSPFGSRKLIPFIAKSNKQDLTVLGQLLETRKVAPIIDRVYKLSETSEAIRYLEEGHARGKVIIAVNDSR